MVERLRSRLQPDDTLLDVGAGGGRLALPLALSCRSVTAVEPSPSMCAVLRETAEENGIDVGVVEAEWADAQVEAADVILCSHVIYVIEDIGAFVSKINSHAQRSGVDGGIPVGTAIANVPALGAGAQGTRAIRCRACLISGRYWTKWESLTKSTSCRPDPARGSDSEEEAREMIAQRLYIPRGSEAESKLSKILDNSLQEESDGIWRIKGSQPLQTCIVSWAPGA